MRCTQLRRLGCAAQQSVVQSEQSAQEPSQLQNQPTYLPEQPCFRQAAQLCACAIAPLCVQRSCAQLGRQWRVRARPNLGSVTTGLWLGVCPFLLRGKPSALRDGSQFCCPVLMPAHRSIATCGLQNKRVPFLHFLYGCAARLLPDSSTALLSALLAPPHRSCRQACFPSAPATAPVSH